MTLGPRAISRCFRAYRCFGSMSVGKQGRRIRGQYLRAGLRPGPKKRPLHTYFHVPRGFSIQGAPSSPLHTHHPFRCREGCRCEGCPRRSVWLQGLHRGASLAGQRHDCGPAQCRTAQVDGFWCAAHASSTSPSCRMFMQPGLVSRCA